MLRKRFIEDDDATDDMDEFRLIQGLCELSSNRIGITGRGIEYAYLEELARVQGLLRRIDGRCIDPVLADVHEGLDLMGEGP